MKIKKVDILKEAILKNNLSKQEDNNSVIFCYCSDLARITEVNYDEKTNCGEYWFDGNINNSNSNSKKNKNCINFVHFNGGLSYTHNTNLKSGVRIAISIDDIEDFDINELENLSVEYPLIAVGGRTSETLDRLFESKSKLILKTGRQHDIDGKLYDEYEVFGVRFIKKENKTDSKILSDGTLTSRDHDVYLKIEKIPLTYDEENRILYSSMILFGTVFDSKAVEFKDSYLKQYLNSGFLKSINDELKHEEPSILFNQEQVQNNRYNFDFSPITEEEIIEICINSNIAVFLHGQTGVGKTERMLALDKNLELIDFGCTSSDGFTGIVAKDFNSKELFLYEPYWYKSLCEKCKSEPEKLHILFLEELTNAKNDIQKVAFEVTLNKTLTNSGFRLQLPPNAVVCAAGNEASESKSANAMSEPLFGRFAHVYINTSSEDWLKWALKRKKTGKELLFKEHEDNKVIHPAILDYIRVNGDKVLRTQYTGVTPNADPRKWSMASKALYESNNPNVLRAFVGEEITQHFIQFCKMNLITVDDVINNRCSLENISADPSVRWHAVICLSTVDDENVDKVREFVKSFGPELLAVFDYEWSKDNPERIMKLYTSYERPAVKGLTLNGS
ncbi:MAG: hypothetical protein J1F35_01465 [Erysipelotrichales bacterium]|nr:hypothetical protein [Erysipelotrichales bacterium]